MKDISQKLLRDTFAKPFNDTEGLSRVNASFFLNSDLTAILVSGSLKASPISSKEFVDVAKFSFDFCDFQKSFWGRIFYIFFEESLGSHSNFKFKCPFQKGFYHFTEFPVADSNRFPKTFSSFDANLIVSISLRVKQLNAKAMSRLISITANGSIYW